MISFSPNPRFFKKDCFDKTCSFTNNDSRNLAGSDLTVTAECVAIQYMIGVSLSGLESGNSVVLQNNSADNLNISGNGAFVFSAPIGDLSNYSVTVLTQPTTPNQTCQVDLGSGLINGDDVDNVFVTCSINNYFLGGTISGLFRGNKLLLNNNDTEVRLLFNNGTYFFNTPLPDESDYNVTIYQQPDLPILPCDIANGNSTMTGDDVTDIDVTCEFGDDLIYRHGFENEPANL